MITGHCILLQQLIRAKQNSTQKMGRTVKTSAQVTIVLGFHAIGCEISKSFHDQSTNHVIPNNLPNSLEYLYYVTVVQLLIVVDNFDVSH